MTRSKPKAPARLAAGEKCPHCGGTGGVAEDDDGHACILCGGPRILVDPPLARPGSEKPLLDRVKQIRSRRAAWAVAAGIATAAGGFALAVSAVLALVLHLGDTAGEIAAASVLAPLLFAAFGFARVRQSSRAVRATLDEAQLAVVAELVRARGAPVEPAELAAILHVPVARAEQLCAEAQVEGFLSSSETAQLPEPRLRVDPGPDEPEPLDAERRDRAR